ncbi:hypothetical protein RGQ21_76410 [Kitasatospora aureofaciens]|nr:hypothetical protein RGQ21_76410 [Kitasatospora aureofaciens]
MHKSALPRYFGTREQILKITAEGWRDWSAQLCSRPRVATPGPYIRALYRSDPQLAHAVVDVEPGLDRVLGALLRGPADR